MPERPRGLPASPSETERSDAELLQAWNDAHAAYEEAIHAVFAWLEGSNRDPSLLEALSADVDRASADESAAMRAYIETLRRPAD